MKPGAMKEDPVSIVNKFNECINRQDIKGMSSLMTNDHVFIDREGTGHGPKSKMVSGWKEFYKVFPKYRNTFESIKAEGNRVLVRGYAFWSEEEPYDPVIWSAELRDGLIAEWRVYEDTTENREMLRI